MPEMEVIKNKKNQGVQDVEIQIPAHAGEPRGSDSPVTGLRVNPRARGGTDAADVAPRMPEGLSPRTRGNHSKYIKLTYPVGSIPAHAGEPEAIPCWLVGLRVYPRARGGTLSRREDFNHARGLSPRTRGNPLREAPRTGQPGSIPAHAGEPLP